MAAAVARAGCLLAVMLLLAACRAPWSSGHAARSTVAATPPIGSPTLSVSAPTGTVARSTAPTLAATPQLTSPPSSIPTVVSLPSPVKTPAPVATAVPTPAVAGRIVANCCGTFAWVTGDTLLVYDAPKGQPAGSWLIDVRTGGRRYLAPHFGMPSPDGLVAVSRPDVGQTDILRLDGSVASTLQNGGTETWISPDGSRVAWLARLPGSTPSSLLPRPVRLWTAKLDGSDAHAVLDLLASDLYWLPDNRRVILTGRRLDGSDPGVWTVDVTTGETKTLVAVPFPQALHLSPDGSTFAFLSTFSGRADQDGIWTGSVDGAQRTHLPGVGGVRWSPDSRTLWLLQAGAGSDPDRLVQLNGQTGATVRQVPLAAQVRTDVWEISPAGDAVAYWRDSDGAVIVHGLPD